MNWVKLPAVMVTAALFGLPALSALAQDDTPVADHRDIEIAYVLHGLNTFTEEMVAGAEDAARDYGVTLETFGDAAFDAGTEQANFEAALEQGVDGIAVAPLEGDRWIAPIQEAADQGVPVVGFNVTSLDSALETWVGQDDFASGVTLGSEFIRQLAGAGVTEGAIAVGSCNPDENVLQDREAGLRTAFAGTAFTVLDTQDVHLAVTENLAAWEHLIADQPDIVAAVGLCYVDVPNLVTVKERSGGTWLIGGYNLDAPTLDALKNGQAQVVIGQQEYLQGYLPVAILAEHLINGSPIVTGWLETPAEVVTPENIDEYAAREMDDQQQRDYYREYINARFADLQSASRPYDDLRAIGAFSATPVP